MAGQFVHINEEDAFAQLRSISHSTNVSVNTSSARHSIGLHRQSSGLPFHRASLAL